MNVSRFNGQARPGPAPRTLPQVAAVPAFLLVLLAGYGLARGLSEALAPVDRLIESAVVKKAEGMSHAPGGPVLGGMSGRTTVHDEP